MSDNTGIDVSEDIAVAIGSSGVIGVLFLLNAQYKKWVDFFKDVTLLEDGSNISIFKDRLNYFNLVTIVYYGFCIVGILIYGLINFTQTTACEQLNEEKNLHEVCGTFYPIWLPFTNINIVSIIIISVAQLLICVTILPQGAMVTCIVLESTELLIIHLSLLNESLLNLFERPGEISDKLRFCVNYHVRILSMATRLNILIKHTTSHMAFMSAVVFGVILNQMISTTAATGAIFLIGYITAIFILCHSGEIIKNKTLSVVDAVWASNWYKADAKTMKDLAFIIYRGQKPIYFDALPFGTLDYPLFIMVLKTSYSYLTLLNEAM